MKTLFGFIGWAVGMLVGFMLVGAVPILGFACVIGGMPLGRYIGGLIEESQEETKKAREREKRERYQREREDARRRERRNKAITLNTQYPEATKKFFKMHWGMNMSSITQYDISDDKVEALLSHSEYEYQRQEELLNDAYRKKVEAQRQFERQAAERKRREEELARQKKEEERRNISSTLPNCVLSWHTHSNSSLKHLYFYDYYPYQRYKNDATAEMWNVWRVVWHFKNDPFRNVSNYEHDMAVKKVIDLVESALKKDFGTKTEYLTLVCLTASTQRKTELRYKDFADRVCKDLKMTNAYPHIRVLEDGDARHEGGEGSHKVFYDSSFFKGKYVVLFDDVRTTGKSLEQERHTLEEFGAKVICAVTVAQTKQ